MKPRKRRGADVQKTLSKSQFVFKHRDNTRIPIWFKISRTESGSGIIANTPLSDSSLLRLGKSRVKEVNKILETVGRDFLETVVEIDNYCVGSVKLSSVGAWNVGKILDSFLEKYEQCAFKNLFITLRDWFKDRIFATFFRTAKRESKHQEMEIVNQWKSCWYFYKMYDLNEINKLRTHKWAFENITKLGKRRAVFRTLYICGIHKEAIKIYDNHSLQNISELIDEKITELENDPDYEKDDEGRVRVFADPIIVKDRDGNKHKELFYQTGPKYIVNPEE